MNRKKICTQGLLFSAILLVNITICGCEDKKIESNLTSIIQSESTTNEETTNEETTKEENTEEEQTQLTFVDVKGNEYTIDIHNDWPLNPYNVDNFVRDENGNMSYLSEEYTYRLGVDVSKYSAEIDWAKVKADGYEFAIIRVGFRGYGNSGQLVEDPYAVSNLKGALEAGLDVGVYFFSQAISEEEAIEEAKFTIEILEKAGVTSEDLKMPVVFDPETITDDDARTDDVSGEQFTANALAYLKKIESEGFTGMIYSNMLWEAYQLDLNELSDYPVWYADYEDKPQTPYAFEIWQYSESANVSGIPNLCDVNIQMIKQ